MRVLKIGSIVVLSFIVIVVGVAGGLYLHDEWRTETQQEALAGFYTPPDPISGDPGTVIRSELAPQWDVTGGTASRILYVTQGTNGEPRVTGGMVWIPTKPSDNTERKVAGPAAVDWIQDRFDGKPTQPNCSQRPPVAPYDPTATGATG